jgi:hypothetical protein
VFVTVCSRPIPAARFVGIFVGIVLVSGEQTFTANFAIPNEGIEQMARKNDGGCANPKQIRTDVDCRAARPKFDNDAWSPAKISDVTGRGLYLFVTPDESRPGNAASKLWRIGYRFHTRQKTYSIGPCGNGKDGTFSLADARRERDKAKDLLKEGKDPSTEKPTPKIGGARSEQEPAQGDEFRLASATREVLLMSAVACPTVVRSVTGRFACARSFAFVLTSCFSPAVANSEGGDLSFSGDENRDSTDPTLVRSSEFGSSFFF